MKTFVFDADGVVCSGQNFGAALEAKHDIPSERLQPFFSGHFVECLLGRCDLKEVIVPYAKAWGWPRSVDDLLAFWFQAEHSICPAVLACVRKLRTNGHRCVLGTNQEAHRAAYLRREMGLAEEFDHLFVSCEMGVTKPSIDFFRQIESRLGLKPTQLCLIDDSRKNVLSASSAGWRTILYRGRDDIGLISDAADQVGALD